MAKAQVALAFVFLIFIFGLVFLLVLYRHQMDSVTQTIVGSIIAALVTVLTLQQNFFFARQRPPSADSPPSAPTLTGVFNGPDPNAPNPQPVPAKPAPPGAPRI